MLKYSAITAAVLLAVVFAFSAIPAEKVGETYKYSCSRTQEWIDATKKRDADKRKSYSPKVNPDGSTTLDLEMLLSPEESDRITESMRTYEVSVRKSGIRRSIEARLQWLGFDDALDFLNTEKCDRN